MLLLLFLLTMDLLDSTQSAEGLEMKIRKGLRFGKRDELIRNELQPCIMEITCRSGNGLKMDNYPDRPDHYLADSETNNFENRRLSKLEQINKMNDLMLKLYFILKKN